MKHATAGDASGAGRAAAQWAHMAKNAEVSLRWNEQKGLSRKVDRWIPRSGDIRVGAWKKRNGVRVMAFLYQDICGSTLNRGMVIMSAR